MRDRDNKGRQARGERSGQAKLTEIKVKEIKVLLNQGMNCSEVAKLYSVGKSTIFSIKCGKNWKHIK